MRSCRGPLLTPAVALGSSLTIFAVGGCGGDASAGGTGGGSDTPTSVTSSADSSGDDATASVGGSTATVGGSGGHMGSSGVGGVDQGGAPPVPWVCALDAQPLCSVQLAPGAPEVTQRCLEERCCGEMVACVEVPGCVTGDEVDVSTTEGSAVLSCFDERCLDYVPSDAVSIEVCGSGLSVVMDDDHGVRAPSRAACLSARCCAAFVACTLDGEDVDGCAACLGTDDPRCADANACLGTTCASGICDSGLETDDILWDGCIAEACCTELEACTEGGSDPQGCIDCIESCGGPRCDAAVACIEAAGCEGWTPAAHEAALGG